MSRKVRMADVAEAASWYFGTGLDARPATRRVITARRCAYKACRELGFTWNEIANAYDRDHSTVISALSNGHVVDPDDVAAVLSNARARALADPHDVFVPVDQTPVLRHTGTLGNGRLSGPDGFPVASRGPDR